MIDIKIRYSASIFANSIDATPDNITTLLKAFSHKGFIPNTFQEMSTLNPISQTRFRLSSINNEWVINFGTGRIDILKNQTDSKGDNIGDLEDFCKEVIEIYSLINVSYPRIASRLALCSNFLLKEMSHDQLDKIYSKLFNPPQIYRDNSSVEWNFRTVTRISKSLDTKTELINFVTEINRLTGQMNVNQSLVPFDRIAINLDINTLPNAIDFRFDTRDIENFYSEVITWQNDILNDILEITE